MENNVKLAVPLNIHQRQIEALGQRVLNEMSHDFVLKAGIQEEGVLTKFADEKCNFKKLPVDVGERLGEDLKLWLLFTTGLKLSSPLFWIWTNPRPTVQMALIDYVRICEHVRTKYLEDFVRFCRDEADKPLLNLVKNNLWGSLEHFKPQQAGKVLLFLQTKAPCPIEELPILQRGLYKFVQRWLQGRIVFVPGKPSKWVDGNSADFMNGKFWSKKGQGES